MMKTASSAKNCQDGLTKQAMAIARRKDNYILDVRHGLMSTWSCRRQSRVTGSSCFLHVDACQFRSIRIRRRRPRRHSLCNQKRRASEDRSRRESGPKNWEGNIYFGKYYESRPNLLLQMARLCRDASKKVCKQALVVHAQGHRATPGAMVAAELIPACFAPCHVNACAPSSSLSDYLFFHNRLGVCC